MTGARRSGRGAVVACVAMLALVSGCGDETPPGDTVPALSDRLELVDQAVESGDYQSARAQLDMLVAETARAEVAGQISDEQADRILNAVEAVLAGLPGVDEGSGSPPADPQPEPEPPADSGSSDEDGAEDGEKDKKDKPEKDED